MVMFDKQRSLQILLFVFFFKNIASSGLGKCPKFAYMDKFNLSRFTGRWYEIERSFYLAQIYSSCMSVDLTENARGQLIVDVKSRSRWSGTITINEGIAAPSKRDASILVYKVVTKLPKVVARYLPGAGLYQIIDTDYDNYAVLWSCTDYGLIHTDFIWIWGRRTEFSADQRAEIYQMLDTLRLDSERLILPKNGNCSEIVG